MKFKLLGLVASLMLFGAMPIQAVPLVDQGNNTYDPNTGLLWLDVTLTSNLSYNDVNATLIGPGQLYDGYRYATDSEVLTLFADAGFAPTTTSIPGVDPNIAGLIALLGQNNPFGMSAMTLSRTPVYLQAQGNSVAQLAVGSFYVPTFSTPSLGGLLVTDAPAVSAVPIPAAFPLFASGLGALGLLAWRRKRKVAAGDDAMTSLRA